MPSHFHSRVSAAALFSLGVAALVSPSAHAVAPFVVKDIRVEGLQRTDPGAVFAALPFRIGDTYTDEKAAVALRSLFATGLFKDVRIEVEGEVVVVIVDERSVIANVNFVGLKEFDKDQIVKSLKDAGIGEGLPFDRALVDRAEQEIKRQYLSRSLYGAEVVTTITPVERNRVNVTFTMSEGDAAKIREIRIQGNKAFGSSQLLGLFDLTDSGWLTWYTKSDRYSRAKLNADLETLRTFYLNRGYLEFTVESTQVTISPDKQDIAISITVNEGQPYTVTGIRMDGDYLGKDAEFRSLLLVKVGQAYSGADVTESARLMTDLYGSYGYAFARVEPRPELDRATGQAVVVFSAEPSRRVYVRRVELSGNSRTRDEVVRREFRQLEASWYDAAKITRSKERLERLNFFKDINVETVEVPGSPDQVDLQVTLTEKATGNLMVGAGYSSAEKLTFTASIRQDNVFGSGNYLGFDVSTGKYSRNFVLSTVDPYFTVDGVSRSFDIYYRTSRPFNSLGDQYQLATPGASVRFGIPYSETDTVYAGFGFERTEIQGTEGLPNSYFLYRQQYGKGSNGFPLTLGWSRDSRDSLISPTRGTYQRVAFDGSLFGDVRYLRTNLQFQQYWPLPAKMALGFNTELGLGKGLGGRPFPVFKNFYGGGLGSVRVFEQGSLGVIDPTGAYIGGTQRFNANLEMYFPVPGSGNNKELRIFTFADTGNVWRENEKFEWSSLRASAGVGLSWMSPVGPLRLSYGVPLQAQRNDRIQRFQFQIGAGF